MPYPFIEDDGGRSESQRPRQKEDCTVRALAVITGWTYDQVYDLLKKNGRRSHSRFHLGPWLKSNGYRLSEWAIMPLTFPAVKGERRMNPVTFISQNPHGRWIVKTATHVFAIVDGVAHDLHPERDDRCIYKAWRFLKH
jgi:hypothetical protein